MSCMDRASALAVFDISGVMRLRYRCSIAAQNRPQSCCFRCVLVHRIKAWGGILVLESAPIWMESGARKSLFRSLALRLEPVSISILGLSSTHFGCKALI